ncbi:MAG: polysaccharide biosynthesis tyrosine autokinase [Planctomycetaceae bacterium]|nr:polysaccharide biosynthesis tyrosine autokinase [Planctomycetaceae bacterium]
MKPEAETSSTRIDGAAASAHRGLAPIPTIQVPKAPTVTSGNEGGAGPNFLLHVLRRWWKVAMPVGLLLAAIGVTVVVLLFVPQYEAQALLEIAEQPQYIAFAPRQGERTKAYFLTQMQLIQSAWIMGRVVAEPTVAGLPEIRKQADPIAWLSKYVRVAALADSDAFTISYASADPRNAALVVNEVATQYLKARRDTEAARNKDIIRALTREMGVRHEAVAALRAQIGALAKQLSARDMPLNVATPSSGSSRNPFVELQGRLITLQLERAIGGARVKALEEQMQSATQKPSTDAAAASQEATSALSEDERTMRDLFVEQTINDNSAVKVQTERVSEQQALLSAIESVAVQGNRSSAYLRRQAELRHEEEALAKLKDGLRARATKEAEILTRAKRKQTEASALAKRREELLQLRCILRGYQIAEQNLTTECTNYQKEMEKTSGDTLDLLFKKDELSQSEMVLDRITARQFELQTEQGAPPRIIWHQEAVPPQAPVQALPYRNAGLALLIGFCLPFGAAAAWERYARRIGDSEALRRQSSLTILGETTRLPTKARDPRLATGSAVRSELEMFEESVDSLRTSLILSSDMRDVRVLAVTSASKDEGKTSVAAQLAVSLARAANEMILLIDGDLRSPDIHRVFDLPVEPGLAEVLAEECPIEKAIVPAGEDGLVCILPAGRPRSSPHRLLGNGSWRSLVQRIPAAYRYVIVDTPPVLAASEALVLARGADASLVCVMRDVSRVDQVQKATERLLAAGGHVVGAVLNGVPARQYAYRYGRYAHDSED